jgi:hypothetical protein
MEKPKQLTSPVGWQKKKTFFVRRRNWNPDKLIKTEAASVHFQLIYLAEEANTSKKIVMKIN